MCKVFVARGLILVAQFRCQLVLADCHSYPIMQLSHGSGDHFVT